MIKWYLKIESKEMEKKRRNAHTHSQYTKQKKKREKQENYLCCIQVNLVCFALNRANYQWEKKLVLAVGIIINVGHCEQGLLWWTLIILYFHLAVWLKQTRALLFQRENRNKASDFPHFDTHSEVSSQHSGPQKTRAAS